MPRENLQFPQVTPDDEVLNKQLSNLVDQMADNPTPSQKVPQSIANSTHAQSVMNNKTLSQQQVEENFQRIMDAINPPDYGKQLTDLLNPKKQKVTQSVANSTHAQSILNDNTLSQPQQEDYLQRLMDALEAKNKEHEAAKKSSHSLDFILNPETNTNKSQTEREEDYMRALQHLLQPGQTESEYRKENFDLSKHTRDRNLLAPRTTEQLARASSDPLYVLERRMEKYSPTQYSQEELGQIYDRATQQIIPFGLDENGYRQRTLLQQSLTSIPSPLPDMSDAEWQKTVFNMRVDGAHLNNWALSGDANDPNNCYFWALGIWISQRSKWAFSHKKNAPGVFSGKEISPDDIKSVLNKNGSVNRQKLDALTKRMGNSLMLDAAYLGYNVRCMHSNLWNLNLLDADAIDQRLDFITLTDDEKKETNIYQLQQLGQKVENDIVQKLAPNEVLIVMAINPHKETDSIHFYRRDPNGNWSQKPGIKPLELSCDDPFITPETRIGDTNETSEYNIVAAYAISDPRTTLSK